MRTVRRCTQACWRWDGTFTPSLLLRLRRYGVSPVSEPMALPVRPTPTRFSITTTFTPGDPDYEYDHVLTLYDDAHRPLERIVFFHLHELLQHVKQVNPNAVYVEA